MKETELIQIALMLTSPWKVAECQFDVNRKRLAPSMTVKRIAELEPEHDTRLWRLLHHHVKEAREQVDYSDVKQVGIDETSSKRGHNYVTLAVDLNESKTIFATEGKDSATIGLFKDDLTNHGGDPESIDDVSCDMSPAFIKGVEENFPNAQITFDKFMLSKHSTKQWMRFAARSRKDILEGINSLVRAAKARARGVTIYTKLLKKYRKSMWRSRCDAKDHATGGWMHGAGIQSLEGFRYRCRAAKKQYRSGHPISHLAGGKW